MASNLPPGVTDSMIPGNRPEDLMLEDYGDELDILIDEAIEVGVHPHDLIMLLEDAIKRLRDDNKAQ